MYLWESLYHKPSLVLIQRAIELLLGLVYPLSANYLAFLWSIHKVPSVVLHYRAKNR